MEKKNRIILFWVLTIVGFLTHSLTDALPAVYCYHAYDVCIGIADGY